MRSGGDFLFTLKTRRDIPRQQLLDAIDRMLSNVHEHVSQVRLRIQLVELGRTQQRVDRRSTLTAGVGTRKQVILSSQRDDAQGSLGGVVVDLDAANA